MTRISPYYDWTDEQRSYSYDDDSDSDVCITRVCCSRITSKMSQIFFFTLTTDGQYIWLMCHHLKTRCH